MIKKYIGLTSGTGLVSKRIIFHAKGLIKKLSLDKLSNSKFAICSHAFTRFGDVVYESHFQTGVVRRTWAGMIEEYIRESKQGKMYLIEYPAIDETIAIENLGKKYDLLDILKFKTADLKRLVGLTEKNDTDDRLFCSEYVDIIANRAISKHFDMHSKDIPPCLVQQFALEQGLIIEEVDIKAEYDKIITNQDTDLLELNKHASTITGI